MAGQTERHHIPRPLGAYADPTGLQKRLDRTERAQSAESVQLLREIRDGIAELNRNLAALLPGDGPGET